MSERWFVAVTNVNCLNRAEGELGRLGYRTFVPRVRKWVSHARVRKAVKRPLLGRYLFVDVANGDFHAVRGCNGIEGLVGVAGEPMALPPDVVPDLIRREMEGEWDFVERADLPVGARVKLIEGEFNDRLATLTKHKRGRRVEVKFVGTAMTRTVMEWSVRPAA